MPSARRPALTRRRRILIVAAVVLVLLILSARTFAVFYTDALWFSSVQLHSVWLRLLETKVGLAVTFALIFAVMLTVSLLVAERLAPKGPSIDAEDEFVQRYRQVIGPYARWLRAIVIVILSLILGSQAMGQWQNWLLYRNATPFGVKDPQFHRDVGYFVFTLPFQQFLVHWTLVSLVVVLVVTVLSHYLNGGIRLQGPRPRVRPAVKAHISVILGLLALVKAVGYYLARFNLDLSSNGYVQGASYTDVHARIPALQLLILVSLAAAVLLIYNIRRQGWALPILGVGLWFLVALTAGTIYPAVVQALRVTPAQNTLESPYIHRNIVATRAAMGINHVKSVNYPASSDVTAAQLSANHVTLNNTRLWDPTQTQATYDKLQDLRTQYQFYGLALDRYRVNGAETPTVVGVREVNDNDLPSSSWVNTKLAYTHGYGMVISPANTATNQGEPNFAVGGVPPTSSEGLPEIRQPSVYFGLDNSTYVVANSKTPEIDFQLTNGRNVATHYKGDGGVQLTSLFRQAMFALRFGDLNLLISDQITPDSRLLFDRGIQERVQKAAPFLALDADPYPVLVNGQIEWIQDAYTTTNNYPYAQEANTTSVSQGSGLDASFNYVRNSVKVAINAYTGHMTFYVMESNDPVIRTYEKAFPGMFTPASKMSAQLRAHLRYPEDLFTVQTTMYGRYHITDPQSFYNAADAWVLSPTPGAGSPDQALRTTVTTNSQGVEVSTGQTVRMSPLYQVMQIPGQTTQSFNILEAFVPVSGGSQIQNLSGFMIGGSDPADYGNLTMYVTPRNSPAPGPSIVASQIDSTPAVSQEITYFNQNGSSVVLGNVLMIPVADALLYVQPMYVESSRNSLPLLKRVIAVYGKSNAAVIDTTLSKALTDLFQGPVVTNPGTGGGTGAISSEVQGLVAQAQSTYQQAQADLKSSNLGAYQNDVATLGSLINEINQLTGNSPSGGGSSATPPTSTTTTTAPHKGGSSASRTGSATSSETARPATTTTKPR